MTIEIQHVKKEERNELFHITFVIGSNHWCCYLLLVDCLKYDIILTFTYFVVATFIATHTLQHKSNIFI